MINGVVIESIEGTPQGGTLSPLLSNIVLNELDKELESRGLRFVRYADDCMIFVKSKSKVALYNEVKYLGFVFYHSPQHRQIRIRVHEKSIKRINKKKLECKIRF